MEIKRVDHYSIRTNDLAASRDFYTKVIGLTEGPRPPFDFPGYWLYSGEPPKDLQNGARNYGFVHLMGFDKYKPGSLDAYVGDRGGELGSGTGSLDHVAFAATGRAGMLERCRTNNVSFFERAVPMLGLRQVFVKDPDGVTIELNFPASEVPEGRATESFTAAR
jgi:catechol 2,3-dioxygenase-like lactoylglutathione lyase family enzyme